MKPFRQATDVQLLCSVILNGAGTHAQTWICVFLMLELLENILKRTITFLTEV